MSHKAYPQYHSTGIDWLGDVPQHWRLKRFKFAVNRVEKKTEVDEDDTVLYVGLEHIESWTGTLLPLNPDLVPSGMVNVFVTGNTLFGKLRPYLAKASNVDFNGVCSTELLVLNGKEINRRLLLYFLLSNGFIKIVDSSTFGTKMPRANWEFIGSTPLPIPPADEQLQIADFLDREIGRIDLLVGKKRELVERLKEKRSALISSTVTRGLPPEAARAVGLPEAPPLKPTNIAWMGDIPSHWNPRRLRHISDTITVGVVVNPSSYFSDEGVPFLLGGDIREFTIDISNCKRCSQESSDGPLRKSRLDEGDLVVVRVGYPGIAAVVPSELAGANCASMMLVRRHSRFVSKWLAYAFNSQMGRDQIEIVQYGAAQKQFNISHAVDFWFAFPPLEEQQAIVEFLDRETCKLNGLVAKIESAIERLQEYRAALINAAVTGKIDVRKAIA